MRRTFLLIPLLLAGCADTAPKPVTDETPIPNRPKVQGKLRLTVRERKPDPAKKYQFVAGERVVEWDVSKTAVIVCDMWDDHFCKGAAERVGVMAPRMNAVLSAARAHGVQIMHAPSGTIYMYADLPQRKRVVQAKPATPPVPIPPWCNLDPGKEPPMPVDVSKCSCDDPVVGAEVRKFSKQHPALDITGYDGVSDDGKEIYNFFAQEGINNVAIMGVHTNMCVLGRSFGIRQLTRLGMNVVLVRDLTDAMYDPRQPPHVSHARGTELVVEHIEKHWCGSVLSKDLTAVMPGSAGP
jgi:nicotinamidase-related amidase